MKEEQSETPYKRALGNACILISDGLAQIGVVCGILQRQKAPDGVSVLKLDPVLARSLNGAVILHEFSALEAVVNFLADLAVETSKGLPGSPPLLQPLGQIEIDFLTETRTEIDSSTGGLRKRGAYPPTIDKLAIVPTLLAKLHGRGFRLDKGTEGWRKIKGLKATRDKLTHPRFEFSRLAESAATGRSASIIRLDEIEPALDIKFLELFEGAEGLMWYLDQIANLFRDLLGAAGPEGGNIFESLFVAAWTILFNLHEECGISRSEFFKAYTPPLSFEPVGQGLFAVKVNRGV